MKMQSVKRTNIIAYMLAALLAAALLVFSGGAAMRGAIAEDGQTEPPANSEPEQIADYEAKNFESLPDSWELVSDCDSSHTKTAFHNGEMMIMHDNTSGNAAVYYGSAYKINKDVEYGDFIFEMTFRAVQWNSESRFFAILFHSKAVGTRLVGYYVNYRISGGNAISALNANKEYSDSPGTASTRLDDKGFHTIKIELSGTSAHYYMDDMPITIAAGVRGEDQYTWNTSSKDSHVGGKIEKGGFALMINQQTMSIKSVKITTPKPAPEPELPEVDDELVKTYYDMTSGTVNMPTVVCDVRSEDALNGLTGEVLPQNAILTYEGGKVMGDGGEICTFEQAYAALGKRVIPVVRIERDEDADAFITYMTETKRILDLSVMSSDPAVLKKLRTALPWTRGVLQFSQIDPLANVVATANTNLASTIVLPAELCTLANVTYIQARFKAVWADCNSYLSMDIADCINSGALGIVSPYVEDVYYTVQSYYALGARPRASYNVAHRGCCSMAYENSISAVRLAIANGATHLELDGILTKDGRIAISHDDEITPITTGSGSIAQMTLSQVQSYDLTLRDTKDDKNKYLKDENNNDIIEHMPSLEEICAEMEGNDVVLVFEIKTHNVAIVPELKRVAEQYNITDRLVVITFNDEGTMLDRMKAVMPATPVAILDGLSNPRWSNKNMADMLEFLGTNNVALDKSYSHAGTSLELDRALRDRGLAGWYWTFADEAALEVGEGLGFIGLTNNVAEAYKNVERFVTIAENNAAGSITVGMQIRVTVTYYNGEQQTETGTVAGVMFTDDGWRVIAAYESTYGTMYTMSATVYRVVIAE